MIPIAFAYVEPTAMTYFFVVLAVLLALAFEFVNGFHDTANAVATVIYTNTLKATPAVVWSGIWNLIGVLTSSGLVAFSIVALLPVQIKATSNGFPPTGLAGKYSSTPKKGSVDNLISVWPAEELKITIEIPEPFKSNPPAGLITWNAPDHTVPDQTTEFTFSWLDTGSKTITITIGGSTFKVVVDVPNVGNISQGDALLALDPITAASVVAFGIDAMNYSNDPANFPSVVPKKDAIRHSYWTALCASDILVDNQGVLFVTTAHEHNNKWGASTFGGSTAPQQAFNSTMDLRNNLIGIATSHMTGIGTPDRPAILQDLNQQYQQGLMWIYDGSTSEAASEGILSKSNRQKIFPP